MPLGTRTGDKSAGGEYSSERQSFFVPNFLIRLICIWLSSTFIFRLHSFKAELLTVMSSIKSQGMVAIDVFQNSNCKLHLAFPLSLSACVNRTVLPSD
jgi:hypothetical protein